MPAKLKATLRRLAAYLARASRVGVTERVSETGAVVTIRLRW